MRFMGILASMFLSTSVLASVNDISWSEIESNGKYFVDAPQAIYKQRNPKVKGTIHRRFIGVDGVGQACLKGDKIYGGVIQGCTKVSDKSKFPYCKAWAPTEIWAKVSGERKVCVRYSDDDATTNCIQHIKLSYNYSGEMQARIYNRLLMTEDYVNDNHGFLGKKTFSLPKCGKNTPTPPDDL